jgi:hypothetical protein
MDWLFDLPVAWMTLVILLGVYAFTFALYLVITRLATGERARAFKAVSPGMLPPLAIVFALLIGFLAAQVWNDADRAGSVVNREASALRAAVLLADQFPGEPERRFRELIHDHIQATATEEWPAMARHGITLAIIPAALAEALHLALALEPRTTGQTVAQRELVVTLQAAFDARRQRILLSESSVDGVKWWALLVQVGLILLTTAMVHSDNRLANRIILWIFATAAATALLLIAAHSGPYSGDLSVGPDSLLQVMPEAGR